VDFSLFYFADDASADGSRYGLLLAGARFADEHGLAAVWTPERHFHSFGGLYPNPAVTGAAVAAVTERVAVRAGSVVAPLHHPLRIAEEWSVVDNISAGRAGVSFASGWHAVDFAIRPESYAKRKKVLVETIESVRRLWRREHLEVGDGEGNTVAVQSFPAPIQRELPMWLTCAANPDTFKLAGELRMGVLTHLLGQDLGELAEKIALYRAALRAEHGPEAGPGHVVLMLHTLLGEDRAEVREVIREPFSAYLRSSIGLSMRSAGDVSRGIDPGAVDPDDVRFLVERSFDRYFDSGGLFGTVSDGLAVVRRLARIGIDEVACLIDFGVAEDRVLKSLEYLGELNRSCNAESAAQVPAPIS
jgi:natural product biosynthesis luciferase-like monooxygenase protein